MCRPLPYINMNQRQVSRAPFLRVSLPSPTPSHPSSLSQSTGLNFLCHIANSHLLSLLHMAMYMFSRYSQFLPLCPSPTVSPVCSLCSCLHCCPAEISSSVPNFLDSVHMCWYIILSSSFWLFIPFDPYTFWSFWPSYLSLLSFGILHCQNISYNEEMKGWVAGILPYSRCRRECFQQTPCSFMFLYWNIILALQCFSK